MKPNCQTDWMPDYLDGLLPEAERQQAELHLAECAGCLEALDQMRGLWQAFDAEPLVMPPARMKVRFLQNLQAESERDSQAESRRLPRLTVAWRVAAAIALLLTGYWAGRSSEEGRAEASLAALEQENAAMRQTAMFSLMDSRSASKRIQGVQYAEALEAPAREVIAALVARLERDENTNVRLAAVSALEPYVSEESVKTAFLGALESQPDPVVQIRIIKALVQIKEKRALEPMQMLLDRETTQPFIKDQLKVLIPSLS